MAQPYINSRSPPPLQHPKPTHPAYPPPEPPKTPGGSTNSSPYSQAARISQDGAYVRYSSPPVGVEQQAEAASSSGVNPYAAPQAQTRSTYTSSPPAGLGMGNMQHPQGYQSMGNFGANGWGTMNDATAQMGVQFGKSAVAAGQEYMEKNVSRELSAASELIKPSSRAIYLFSSSRCPSR